VVTRHGAVRNCGSCGRRLAQDNRDDICSLCQKKEAVGAARAPDVPAEFWAYEDLQCALDTWHMGKVIAAYRVHPLHRRPLSQEVVAGWVGISQVQLSRIENGGPIRDLDRLEMWARTLRIPENLLWFRLTRGVTEADDGFNGIGGSAVAASALEDLDAWQLADALTRSPISVPTLAEMEQAVYGYAARYPHTPPAALLPPVARQMTRMRLVISEPQPLAVRRRCVALLGILSGVAGHLALDLGHHSQAEGMFRVGQLAAHEADNHDLAAWIAATQSIGPFYAGRVATAADLLAHAEREAAQGSSQRRRAWAAALHARALAAAGRHHDALAALDRAHAHLAATADPPSGTDFFDQHRLDGLAGECHLLLREPKPAAHLLGQALARRDTSDAKGRALLTLNLAACRVIEHEPEQATQLIGAALELAHGALVRPILDRARAVRADMAGWSPSPPLADLDARLVG
jgi:transcriptional regulator with XRE-family HTH domain